MRLPQWRKADEDQMSTFIKVRVKKSMADRLKKHGHVSELIRRLLEDYFEVGGVSKESS
jgi:hypothetical protein